MENNWFFKRNIEEKANFLPALIQKPEIIETVEAEEIKESSINYFGWEVEECKIFDRFGNQIENWKELKRNDTKETLHICKNTYRPTTNEYFSETVSKIQDITGFKIETFEEAVSAVYAIQKGNYRGDVFDRFYDVDVSFAERCDTDIMDLFSKQSFVPNVKPMTAEDKININKFVDFINNDLLYK
jgi:hypothetical protein